LYVATERLCLEKKEIGLPGWGVFPTGLRLTAAGRNPSCWTVPGWLNPAPGGVGMSFHPTSRWSTDGTMQCVGRGQEFVARVDGDSAAFAWLHDLFGKVV
jgi:Nucleotide modification associated domain 3